jgi:hypothetical protein
MSAEQLRGTRVALFYFPKGSEFRCARACPALEIEQATTQRYDADRRNYQVRMKTGMINFRTNVPIRAQRTTNRCTAD